jgi:hypothetical protein
MPLDLPAGQTVFLDSTVIHYAFVDFPGATQQCIELLNRVAKREVSACLTVPILNDAVHKVMCSEAAARFNQPRAGLVRWMKSNAAQIRQLARAAEVLRLIEALPVAVLDVDLATLVEAQIVVREHTDYWPATPCSSPQCDVNGSPTSPRTTTTSTKSPGCPSGSRGEGGVSK